MMNSTSQLYPGGCDAAVDDGVMIDLSPYLEEYAPDYWNLVKNKEEYVKFFTTDEGRIVEFVPVVLNGYVDAGYILRQDWLDAVDMDVPTTYDELYEVLTAWKTELGKPNALYINNLGVGNQNSLTDGFGLATVYDPMQSFYPYYVVDGEVKFAYEQDEFKDYLKMMAKWYKEDLVWKDFPTQPTVFSFAQSDAALSDFLNGKLGAVFGEMGDIKAKPKASNDPGMVLIGMPNPVKNKGEKTKITTNEPALQGTWGVTTSCEKVELAVRYINFWYTDVGAELANWGIEGEAFEWVNGERVWTELMTNNPDGLDIKALSTIYIIDDGPFLNYADKFLTMYSDEERAASETWMSVRTGEWTYPGGAQLNLEESELFATKFNDMYTYVAETVPRFITGELDIDAKWEEFISMMNQMGAQECLQAKQAAYDRYQAR